MAANIAERYHRLIEEHDAELAHRRSERTSVNIGGLRVDDAEADIGRVGVLRTLPS